jgi:hypothetical protein
MMGLTKTIWESVPFIQEHFSLYRESFNIPVSVPLKCNLCHKNSHGEFFYDQNQLFCEYCFVDHVTVEWNCTFKMSLLHEVYDSKTSKWIHKQFELLTAPTHIYYEDNFRVAEVGNEREEKLYEEQHKRGCCGFVDVVKEFKGKKYKLGFNFGH